MEDGATDLAARSEVLDVCEDVASYNARKINFVSDEISGNNSTRFIAKIATRETAFDSSGDDNIVVRDYGTTTPRVRADVKCLFPHCTAPQILTPTALYLSEVAKLWNLRELIGRSS